MPETFYRTGLHNIDHSTFGGLVYSSDFNTDYRGKDNTNGSCIAQRIIADWEFDKQCRKIRENNNKDNDRRK